MERVQDDPLKDQHSYFSDVESGRSATFPTRCYDLVRRVLLLRVFAVMVAAFFTGPFFGFHCSELPSVGFPSVGFFDFSFQGTGIPLVWLRTQVSAASFSTDRDDRGTHECFNDLYHANVSFT